MPRIDTVVAVAGWEERFTKGLEYDLQINTPSEVIVFVFEEFAHMTAHQREDIRRFAEGKHVRYEDILVRRDPVVLWNKIRDTFCGSGQTRQSVLVNISTMPREVIWWVFACLNSVGSMISYVYYRPGSYAPDWLTRDTDQPRLVYQLSGISEFRKQTCLLLVSGFDTDRAAQIIQFFEPRAVMVGLQAGAQFDNLEKNVKQSKHLRERTSRVQFFDIDAFSKDHGLAAIEAAIADKTDEYNIVAASLGPKLSAVALYRLYCKNPDIALAYAPSREFNPEYSRGIGEAFGGVLII